MIYFLYFLIWSLSLCAAYWYGRIMTLEAMGREEAEEVERTLIEAVEEARG